MGTDIFDEHPQISVPVACRAGHCGSCLVRVIEGADKLAEPSAWERQTLRGFGSLPGLRLGCCLVITSDSGEITLERVAPE